MVDVDDFNFCAGVWVTGQLKADVYFTQIEGGAYATISHPRVVNPYMLVTINRCDDNPSFSASLPWGVGVGITPDCGQKTVAKYGDTQTHARHAHRFELTTDGYAFGWDQRKTNTQPTTLRLCTSPFVARIRPLGDRSDPLGDLSAPAPAADTGTTPTVTAITPVREESL